MPRRAAALLLVLTVGVAADAQVLHERVVLGGVRCANGVCWKEGRPADGAAAIVSDGEIVPAPQASAQPQGDEPIYSPAPERAPDEQSATAPSATPQANALGRRGKVQMDRATGPEPPGTRVYHEPFNPAVFPFKRMTALDAVGADESLLLAERSEARTRLKVVGADKRQEARDAFWGSILIDFEPNKWVPLPSVATDARILAARVEPPAEVVFARDGADNQYVLSPVGGRHRLVWLTDAPQRYFAGDIPGGLRLADEPRLPEPVPPIVKRRAQKVMAAIGVDARPTASLSSTVDKLVFWFRGFQTGDPPRATESTYVDLALARRGSCRHRSYAFVITALALGIPARYVENELHVFVEVMVPRVGWRRINLGGALVEEQVAGADGKVPYRPKGDDPFPQPPEYAQGNDAVPPEPKPLKEARQAGRGAAGATSSAHAAGSGGHSGTFGGPAAPAQRVDLDKLDADAAPARAPAASVATSVTVSVGARDTVRGDRLEVSGTISAADGKPGGLPVDVYVDAPGGAIKVATTTAAADGTWRVAFDVPGDLPLGDHRVVARTPGDGKRKPSRSR